MDMLESLINAVNALRPGRGDWLRTADFPLDFPDDIEEPEYSIDTDEYEEERRARQEIWHG